MRLRCPSFEFSGFLFGVLASVAFVESVRRLLNGAEPNVGATAVACGVSLLIAIACFAWSIGLGNRLRRIREWRLPESGHESGE